jgi:hypothetical protein
MTVFHNTSRDLNYRSPAVLGDMLDTIFFYGNLGSTFSADAPALFGNNWARPARICLRPIPC